jgi:rRNA small subunit pseudouridine methyltransferase Nep1
MTSMNKRKRQEQQVDDDNDDQEKSQNIQTDGSLINVAKKTASTDKRLIVVLEQANLETIKIGKVYELLNCDRHKNHLLKYKRDPNSNARPDITHQCLLMLLDSPLNRANLLQVKHIYHRTISLLNTYIEIARTACK